MIYLSFFTPSNCCNLDLDQWFKLAFEQNTCSLDNCCTSDLVQNTKLISVFNYAFIPLYSGSDPNCDTHIPLSSFGNPYLFCK